MNTYYFLKELRVEERRVDIEGLSHSLIPRNNFQRIETLYIDLEKSEEELLMGLHRTNRKQIRKALNRQFIIEVLDRPTLSDIRDFQKFYNHFAKYTKTYVCNSFHVHTMSKLKDKDALIITRLLDEGGEVLCYRVYISDGDTAFSLYSASHFRQKEKAEEKRLLSEASRYLLWQNILYFKKQNHRIYDMGGLTSNKNIRNYKLEFGGEIMNVYSGYEAKSFVGKVVLWMRTMKMKKG